MGIFKKSDFESGKLEQVIANIAVKSELEKHRELFEMADFVFIDGPKDGVTEDLFLKNLNDIEFKNDPIFMVDDIKFLNMLKTWRGIKRKKLDITSFGHWSGTGLIDWNGIN